MFRTFKNLDRGYRQMRLVSIGSVLACMVISAFSIYSGSSQARQAQERIYILANDKVLEALAADRRDNIPVEARDHIRVFHELFFSLEPDEKAIMGNMSRAFYLADASAKRVYDNLKESGYFTGVIAGNMSQSITVDSIRLDMDIYPIRFECHATEKIIRATTITTRNLVSTGWLRNTARSDNNAHGFLIEKLEILDNRNLRVENRAL